MKQVLLILTAIMLLYSCKSTKKTLGLIENIPDEFQVTKMKPLEVPPYFSLSRGKIVKKSENNLSVAEKAMLKESPQE